jgi:hypothetical protein
MNDQISTPGLLNPKGRYTIELTDKNTGLTKLKKTVENEVTNVVKSLPMNYAFQAWVTTAGNPATQMNVGVTGNTVSYTFGTPASPSTVSGYGLFHSIFLTDDTTPATSDVLAIKGDVIGYVTPSTPTGSDSKQGVYQKNNFTMAMTSKHTQRKAFFDAGIATGTFQKIFLGANYQTPTPAQMIWSKVLFSSALLGSLKAKGVVSSNFSTLRELNFNPVDKYFYATATSSDGSTLTCVTVKFQVNTDAEYCIENASVYIPEFVLAGVSGSYTPVAFPGDFELNDKKYTFRLYRSGTTWYIRLVAADGSVKALTLSSRLSANYALIATDTQIRLVTYSTTQVRYDTWLKSDLATASDNNTAIPSPIATAAFVGPTAYIGNMFALPGGDLIINCDSIIDKDSFMATNDAYVWDQQKVTDPSWLDEIPSSSTNAVYQRIAITHRGEFVGMTTDTFDYLYSAHQGVVASSVLLDEPITKTADDILTITYDLWLDNLPRYAKLYDTN